MTMEILARTKDAVYLRLPLEMQRDAGGCSCEQCKQDPALAKWDTLCVPVTGAYEHAHTVHMPSGAVAQFKQHMRERGLLVEPRRKSAQ